MKRHESLLINLVDGFDKYLEPEKKALLLEECGRKCIHENREELIKKAKALYENSKDLHDFFSKFSELYSSFHVINNEAFFIWEKCFCPVINEIPPGNISPTICNCSRGWVKELFKAVTGKDVEAILEETVTKGNSRCKVKVTF